MRKQTRRHKGFTKGFTLIELLIAVVIIGILAAIAIPKFADTKHKAYTAAMKSDLKNMASAAEAYFADNSTYVGYTAPPGSAGVTLTFTGAPAGWSASATHSYVPGKSCNAGVGTGPIPAGAGEGEPKCN